MCNQHFLIDYHKYHNKGEDAHDFLHIPKAHHRLAIQQHDLDNSPE